MAATLGGVHQQGIPGLEDYRPIGIGKTNHSKANKQTQAPKEPANQPPRDKVEISKESKQEPQKESSGGGFLDNLMKTLNPFD